MALTANEQWWIDYLGKGKQQGQWDYDAFINAPNVSPKVKEYVADYAARSGKPLKDVFAYARQTLMGTGTGATEITASGDLDAYLNTLTPEGKTAVGAYFATLPDTPASKLLALARGVGQSNPQYTKEGALAATASVETGKAEQNALLQQNTARKMALLNQALQGQRSQGQAAIRSQLAQRNMLSSGSLQGTMAKNDRYFGELSARGGLEAGVQETGGLMDWLNQEKQNRWQQQQNTQANQYNLLANTTSNLWNQQNLNQQRQWQLQDQSYDSDQRKKDRDMALWGSLLGAGGSIAGGYLGGR